MSHQPSPQRLDEPLHPVEHARLRSGTAARLAGVPVATLRVWERRYGVVAAPKGPTGQRLYGARDVQRLRVLRQLTERGHAIGTLAALELPALQALLRGEPPLEPQQERATAPETEPIQPKIGVIGRSAAQRLQATGACEMLVVHDDLDRAEAARVGHDPNGIRPEVWVLHLPSLQPATAVRVLALARGPVAAPVIVVYAFGPEAAADDLRAAGITVRREPASGREVLRLVAAALPRTGAPAAAWSQALPTNPWDATVAAARAGVLPPAPPRRFNDEVLAALAEQPSTVACECPRHLAEILMQLGGFERYSEDCLSRNPGDAMLHRQLSALAGTARSLFEQALAQVVEHEGLKLPTGG
jgi:MerR family transcriptional regulator, light-induced transcriptional regulator